MAREIVKFEVNKPVEVALEFPTGKNIAGRFGPRTMFSLTGNRVMYLDLGPAKLVTDLGLNPGETFLICKGAKHFDVWLTPATELARAQAEMPLEPPEVTESDLQKQLRESIILANARKQQQRATTPAPPPPARGNGTYGPVPAPAPAVRQIPTKRQFGQAFAQFLVDAGRASKQAESRLAEEGIMVQFDTGDLRALATTMFIEAAKQGFVTWDGGQQ